MVEPRERAGGLDDLDVGDGPQFVEEGTLAPGGSGVMDQERGPIDEQTDAHPLPRPRGDRGGDLAAGGVVFPAVNHQVDSPLGRGDELQERLHGRFARRQELDPGWRGRAAIGPSQLARRMRAGAAVQLMR